MLFSPVIHAGKMEDFPLPDISNFACLDENHGYATLMTEPAKHTHFLQTNTSPIKRLNDHATHECKQNAPPQPHLLLNPSNHVYSPSPTESTSSRLRTDFPPLSHSHPLPPTLAQTALYSSWYSTPLTLPQAHLPQTRALSETPSRTPALSTSSTHSGTTCV